MDTCSIDCMDINWWIVALAIGLLVSIPFAAIQMYGFVKKLFSHKPVLKWVTRAKKNISVEEGSVSGDTNSSGECNMKLVLGVFAISLLLIAASSGAVGYMVADAK